jgi:hypothetical protein
MYNICNIGKNKGKVRVKFALEAGHEVPEVE